MTAALALDDVRVTYPTPFGDIHALDGLSLSLAAGSALAVLGRSGSGKSTFLSVAATLRRPTSGTVVVDGVDVTTLDPRALARFRAESVGVVFQRHHLDPLLTALDNVLYAWVSAPRGMRLGAARARALALLDELGIADCAARRPNQLSGGQGQRVAIARAMFHGPRLLLADEPTGNLDEETAGAVVDMLLGVTREHGATLVVVTHDQVVSSRIGEVLRLSRGRAVPAGGDA